MVIVFIARPNTSVPQTINPNRLLSAPAEPPSAPNNEEDLLQYKTYAVQKLRRLSSGGDELIFLTAQKRSDDGRALAKLSHANRQRGLRPTMPSPKKGIYTMKPKIQPGKTILLASLFTAGVGLSSAGQAISSPRQETKEAAAIETLAVHQENLSVNEFGCGVTCGVSCGHTAS